MDCSTPGFPVLHHLPEFAQTHVHWVGDASNHLILCCPLLLPSIFPRVSVFSSELNLHQGAKDTGASASATVLSVNTAVQRTLKCFSIAPQFESMDRLPSTENLFSRTFPQSRLAPSQVSKGDCSPGFPTLVKSEEKVEQGDDLPNPKRDPLSIHFEQPVLQFSKARSIIKACLSRLKPLRSVCYIASGAYMERLFIHPLNARIVLLAISYYSLEQNLALTDWRSLDSGFGVDKNKVEHRRRTWKILKAIQYWN